MILKKLSCGFEYEANVNLIKDYRYIRLSNVLVNGKEEEQIVAMDKMLDLIFGHEQAEALIDFLVEKYGYADVDEIGKAMSEATESEAEEDEDTKK